MIEVKDLCKNFGTLKAVDHVSLKVEDGQVLSLIGSSGSGKSTVLRCINHLEEPDGGEVFIDGVPVTEENLRDMRQKTAMVFQNFNLFNHMTVMNNITAAPVHVRGLSKEEAEKKAGELLDLVGLSDKADVYPGKLSGGQKQR